MRLCSIRPTNRHSKPSRAKLRKRLQSASTSRPATYASAAELRHSYALPGIITTVRAGWERSARHFLGQLCLFRQPLPDRACRRLTRRLCFANACISLPAWTLAVRSLVTPAIRATFIPVGHAERDDPGTQLLPQGVHQLAQPFAVHVFHFADITFTPLMVCAWLIQCIQLSSAPFRFCAPRSFSSCLAVCASFSTLASDLSSATLSFAASFAQGLRLVLVMQLTRPHPLPLRSGALRPRPILR